VVVALRQANNARRESMRLQEARLVDHKVSRRRECIEALGNLWGAITGMQMEFDAWTEYLEGLPPTFSLNAQRHPGGRGPTYEEKFREEIRKFSSKWQNTIEQPLFVALLVLRGTPLYEAVDALNNQINEIKNGGLEPIWAGLSTGHRPDTAPIKGDVGRREESRNEHLTLARQHCLTRKDVERSVWG